jgi:hypothetical protein
MQPSAMPVQWDGRLKKEVPNVNRVKLVHSVIKLVWTVPIVMLANTVKAKKRTILLSLLIQPSAWDVQRGGRLKKEVPNVNRVKLVHSVIKLVWTVPIVILANIVKEKKLTALPQLILPSVSIAPLGGLL